MKVSRGVSMVSRGCITNENSSSHEKSHRLQQPDPPPTVSPGVRFKGWCWCPVFPRHEQLKVWYLNVYIYICVCVYIHTLIYIYMSTDIFKYDIKK